MPVTEPPVILPTAGAPVRNDSNTGLGGPFEVGSSLYSFAKTQTGSPRKLKAFKSTDQGVTWIEQDAAGAPSVALYDLAYAGGIAYVLHNFTTDYQLTAFNTATDMWGASSAALTPTVVAGYVCSSARIARVSSGDVYAFLNYGQIVPPYTGGFIQYAIFSGAAWSALTDFVALNPAILPSIRQLIVDPLDVIHVFYQSGIPNVVFPLQPQDLVHNTVTTGGVIGAPQVIETGLPGIAFAPGYCSVWNNKLIVPSYTAGSSERAGVWIGDPYTAPVWTFEQVDNIAWGPDPEDEDVFSFVDGDGVLHLFWITLDFNPADPADIIDRMYYATNDGSGWSAPVLFYDEVTDPQQEDPAIDPYDQFLHTLSVTKLANGLFGVVTALEENGFCAGYYLIDSSCDITIEVGPQPSAAHPVFAPTLIIEMGDTGPFPLASAVANQPYPPQQILAQETAPGESFEYEVTAGALPTGMTIRSSTSSTTTTGPVTTSSGITIQGQPTLTRFTGPRTYQFSTRVRLIE